MLKGDVASLRAEYCFALSHLCACPPPVAGKLRLLDFARLLDGIDQYSAEMQRASKG